MTQENRHPSIESFQYCPNCGQKNLDKTSVKLIICCECSFTFYLNPSSGVAIIIENANGEILFTIRALDPQKGKLDLPGGFVDPFETLEDAIRRETKEELNINIESMTFFGSRPNCYPFKDVTYQTVDAVFHTKINEDQKLSLSDEIQGVQWLLPKDIDFSQFAFSSIQKIISAFIEKK